MRASRCAVAEQVADHRRGAAPASSSPSGSTTAAPASSIQRAFVVWWSPVAYGYGTSTAGRAGRRELEHRAAGARDDEVARLRAGRRASLDVLEQAVVPGRPSAERARQLGVVAPSGDVQHDVAVPASGSPPNASSAASLIDRAPEAPSEDEDARRLRRRCRAAARAAARSASATRAARAAP